jgi:hypothetical protein
MSGPSSRDQPAPERGSFRSAGVLRGGRAPAAKGMAEASDGVSRVSGRVV